MLRYLFLALLLTPLAMPAQQAPSTKPAVPFRVYDPGRDAGRDIQDAVSQAKTTHKRVLIEVGGNWCIWCRYFEDFFATHPEIREYRDANYVVVRVNFSEENKNEAVLSQYGKIPGYPHIFVLDSDAKLLHSQDTSELEQGRGYSEAAMKKFLEKWAPPA